MRSYKYRGNNNLEYIINYIIDTMPNRVKQSIPLADDEINEGRASEKVTLKFISSTLRSLLGTYGCIEFIGKYLHIKIAEPKLLVKCYEEYDFSHSVGEVLPFGLDQNDRILCIDQSNIFGSGDGAIYAVTIENGYPSQTISPTLIAHDEYYLLSKQFDVEFILDDLGLR